jgi:signal peptide peptidase SppA
MKILDILNEPWGIVPEKFEQILQVYKSHMIRGEKLDFESRLKEMQLEDKREYRVQNGVAIIDVIGPITKRSSFFSLFFGGASTELIRSQLQQAIEDSGISEIILNIDSPGGTVDGSFELADFIFDARNKKKIRSFSDGMIASAAYLIGASTESITITGKTNQVGSIGVIAKRFDFSKENEQFGFVVHEFVSGRFKNIMSADQPMSDFAARAIQDDVDYLFSIFATDVADRRNMDLQSIIDMEAKVFIGQQAVDVGLTDNVSSLDQMIKGSVPKTFNNIGVNTMSEKLTIEILKSDHPDLYQSVLDAGKVLGASEEKERILGIQKAAFPGQEELCSELVGNSSVSVGEAALRFNSAEKSMRDQAKADIEASAPKPVDVNPTPEGKAEPGSEEELDFDAEVKKYQTEHKCTKGEAIREIVRIYPEKHSVWVEKQSKGGN